MNIWFKALMCISIIYIILCVVCDVIYMIKGLIGGLDKEDIYWFLTFTFTGTLTICLLVAIRLLLKA